MRRPETAGLGFSATASGALQAANSGSLFASASGTGASAAATALARKPQFESQLVTRIQRPDGTYKELDPERAVQLYRYRQKRMQRLKVGRWAAAPKPPGTHAEAQNDDR